MKYIPDVLVFTGALSVFYGVQLIYPPAGYIIAGVGCIFVAERMSKL